MAVEDSELQGYDEAQKEMMEENCIVVDDNDQIIGQESKVNCHLNEGKLHLSLIHISEPTRPY